MLSKEDLLVKGEIEKLDKIAVKDLNLTMMDNQFVADKQYGTGERIGRDINQNYSEI